MKKDATKKDAMKKDAIKKDSKKKKATQKYTMKRDATHRRYNAQKIQYTEVQSAPTSFLATLVAECDIHIDFDTNEDPNIFVSRK